jgi:alkylation response protein AidB-like acyl-CoA dehydrogenase
MDFSMSIEHKMLQESIREFLKKECPMERVRELDEKDEFPKEIFEKIKPLGLSGLTIAEEYGGTGKDIFGGIIVVEELSKQFPSLGWLYVMSAFYGGVNIGRNGDEKQKQFFLPKIAKGDTLFSYAITEPNAGSDAASAQTTATKHNSGFKLNGTKTLITGADHADYILALTRTSENVPKHKGLTMFIVDRKKEGIEITPLQKLGYKGSSCCEIAFDEVELSADDILGGVSCINNGWSQVLATLDVEHLEVAACSVGLAQGAFDEAIKYAKTREQFGQNIGSFQAVQHMLAEMATGIQTARLMLYYTTWLMEQDKRCSLESAMAKYYASEVAKNVSLQAMQIFGGYGYIMDYDIQRYVRDALILPIGGGTTQILKNIIAGRLGLMK